jgi:Zn-dependent protease
MFGRQFQLFKLFGIPVKIDLSWFVLLALISWSLATGLFPHFVEGVSSGGYWAMGFAGAIGLFASTIFHEMSHALTARRLGVGRSS